ncbi:MAG: YbjN domain-containing protein, partial [Chloroflexota bacterium]
MAFGQIFNAMVGFFEEDEWDFQWMEGLPVLSMPFVGNNGRWLCYAQAREKQEQFVFYSVAPVNVPEDRRSAVAEYVTRANYGMIIGNFEMDYEDGEVRYKTSIGIEGAALTPSLARHLVYTNVVVMDRYLPGLLRVIYGEADPVVEIDRIESSDADDSDADDEDSAFDVDTLIFHDEYDEDQTLDAGDLDVENHLSPRIMDDIGSILDDADRRFDAGAFPVDAEDD